MKPRMWFLTLTLALGWVVGDAFAVCGGGGRSSGGGGRSSAPPSQPAFQKWALPPETPTAVLDTTKFDGLADQLSLTDDQKTALDKSKSDIKAEHDRIAKAQTDARSNYLRAPNDEATCQELMRRVRTAAGDSKAFSPKLRFDTALGRILSDDQMARYKELLAAKSG